MPRSSLSRLRKLCLALPEAREVEAWGAPTFRVKTIFAMYAEAGNHHGEGREGVWVKAVKTNQELMVRAAPERFFVPPYVGPSGWIGVYLDTPSADWDELAELLHDAWRMSVPKKLLAAQEASRGERRPDGTTPRTGTKRPVAKKAGRPSTASAGARRKKGSSGR